MGTDHDFNDSLDDIFDEIGDAFAKRTLTAPAPAIDRNAPIHLPAPESLVGGFTQKCAHCRGTGRFCSNVTGRVLGPCFKCKGKGEINFKTSPEARAKRHQASAQRRADRQAEKLAWREQHRDLIAWMEREADRFRTGKTTFDFIHKMAEAVAEFGSLSDAQLAAVIKCKAKSDERQAAWKAQQGRQDVAIDCSKIVAAFDKRRSVAALKGAVGVKSLVLHFPNFTFSPDRREGSVIWVNSKTHTNDRGLPAAFGKIQDGKLSPFRLATPEIIAEIQAVAADPSKASRISGQNFGICCCCGATLTDPVSIEAGIGPICASNWGF
jgi:uncharacterized protein DUF6011